jgi:hypothetical protein
MFSPEGWRWLAERVAEQLGNGGWIVVAGDDTSAAAPAREVAVSDNGDGSYRLTAVATFTENDANFTWEKRLVKFPDGTVIDRVEEDLGRKAQGAEWDIAVKIDFGPHGD